LNSSFNNIFSNRNLLVATKHNKEQAIAPIIEEKLGVKCIVNPYLDTDLLGTFTGEIKRQEDAITTARKKCMMAMQMSNCDLAIASEGSFGPHPTLFFVPANEEVLIFIDLKNKLEIVAREISTNTNFNASEIKTATELKRFAEAALFPTHALILRKSKDDYSLISKGITDWKKLLETFTRLKQTAHTVYVETDMRAMYNPTRMKVIASATEKLIQKIESKCPNCNTPGIDISDIIKGLPCELCSAPTNSTLAYIFKCSKCNFTRKEKYPHNKQFEEARFCNFCNP
jgi:hypothetical protein